MKTLLIRMLFLGLLLAAAAGHAELPAPVAQALRSAGIPADAVSVYAQRVDRDQPLLAHRAKEPVNPASVMKLLTTYAGLELLGPAYTWRTEVYASRPPVGDVLEGDLILKGYGNPALTLESYWDLVRALRQKGVREIRGDLVLDRSYFEPMANDPAAFDGEPYRAYNVAPDALLVNFKATNFHLFADVTSGKISVTVDPDLPAIHVINQLRLTDQPCGDWKSRLGYKVRPGTDAVQVVFDGGYAASCGEKSLELSVLDGDTYAYQLFRQLWQEQGGSLSGKARAGTLPADAQWLAAVDSPPLADVVRQINKFSNNVMARQLFLTLSAERVGLPGNVVGAAAAVRDWLAGKHLEFPELVLENGAGLSRRERISAQHLGDLLLAAYDSPVMPELMSSLPVIAVDGTLQQRMKSSALAGRAHLKSGSLDDVRAVAGYLLDAKGRRWVAVMVVNHARAANSKPAQDALLEWLYRQD